MPQYSKWDAKYRKKKQNPPTELKYQVIVSETPHTHVQSLWNQDSKIAQTETEKKKNKRLTNEYPNEQHHGIKRNNRESNRKLESGMYFRRNKFSWDKSPGRYIPGRWAITISICYIDNATS